MSAQRVAVISVGPYTPNDALAGLETMAAGIGAFHTVRVPAGSSAQKAAAMVAAVREVGADTLILASTLIAKEVAALAAHALGAGLLIDVHTLRADGEDLVAEKRELGGTWDATCTVTGPAVVLGKPLTTPGAQPLSEPTLLELGEGDGVEVLEVTAHDGAATGPALGEAAVVVAGGRGLEGDLTPVRDLAEALGGAVGATRDIVEEGWIGHETMVGQTGTMIEPRLYIGAGLSGAPHHRLGMQAAEVIVAINTDPEAPIMEIADLAVVGDAADVLTEAARLVRERRGTAG